MQRKKLDISQCSHFLFYVQMLFSLLFSLFSKVFFGFEYRSYFPGLVPVSLVTLFSSCVLPLCLGACAPTAPRELRCPPLLHLFIDTGRPHSKCSASLQMTRGVHPGRTVDCNALPSKQGSEWWEQCLAVSWHSHQMWLISLFRCGSMSSSYPGQSVCQLACLLSILFVRTLTSHINFLRLVQFSEIINEMFIWRVQNYLSGGIF